jgi:intron-binding protein aquarius
LKKNNTPSAINLILGDITIEKIFPFTNYFKIEFVNNWEKDLEKVKSMIQIVEDLFVEVEELRAFELLRNNYERGNHLITKQSKIIAMTCTYAALKRREFIKIGFEYDNIIMEESAQILEIESFIPMLLQNPVNQQSRLKRVILIGDNNQLPPIIKSNTIRLFGKMDQSMFSRFIRTGVPYIMLDYQGRTRSSIVDLYRWRYKELNHDLKDLPIVTENISPNPGIVHELQFINL